LLADQYAVKSLPEILEHLHSRPGQCLKILAS
jgi:hypothetical protein